MSITLIKELELIEKFKYLHLVRSRNKTKKLVFGILKIANKFLMEVQKV